MLRLKWISSARKAPGSLSRVVNLGQGREQAKDAIKNDDALATTVLDRVKTMLKNDGAPEEEVSVED